MSRTITVNEERVITDFEKLSKNRKKEVADFIAFLVTTQVYNTLNSTEG